MEASTTQLREFREKPGPVRDIRDSCWVDLLNLSTHRPQEPTFMSVSGDMSCGYSLQPATTKACMSARGGIGTRLQSVTTDVGVKAARVAAKQGAGTGHCPYFPGSLCSLALLKDHLPRASSPERAHEMLHTVTIYHRPLLPQTLPENHNFVCHTQLHPLPSLTEHVSSNKQRLLPPIIWTGNR